MQTKSILQNSFQQEYRNAVKVPELALILAFVHNDLKITMVRLAEQSGLTQKRFSDNLLKTFDILCGDPTGNRTPVSGVRGQRPNR